MTHSTLLSGCSFISSAALLLCLGNLAGAQDPSIAGGTSGPLPLLAADDPADDDAMVDDALDPFEAAAPFSAESAPNAVSAALAASAAGGPTLIGPREGSPVGPFMLGQLKGDGIAVLSDESPTLFKVPLSRPVAECVPYPFPAELNPKVTLSGNRGGGSGFAAVMLTPPAPFVPTGTRSEYALRLVCVDAAGNYYANDAVTIYLLRSATYFVGPITYSPADTNLLVLDRSYTFSVDAVTTSPRLDCWANYWINDQSYEAPASYDARRRRVSFTLEHWAGGRRVAITCRDRRDTLTTTLDLPQTARVSNGDVTPPTIGPLITQATAINRNTGVSFNYSDNRGVLGCSVNLTARGSNKTFIYTLRQDAAKTGLATVPFNAFVGLDFLQSVPSVIDVSAHCFDAAFNLSPIVTGTINVGP
jgi:hypothetical protein